MRVPVTALVVALTLAGCSHAPAGVEPVDPVETEPQSGSVELTEGEPGVSLPFVSGDLVHGLDEGDEPVRLGASINVALIGVLAPAVVPDSGGTRLVYNAWREDRPVLRMHDLDTGEDEELDEGAASAAWRGDGALAYFRAASPEFGDPAEYVGHVVVRGAQGEPAAWTVASGRYVVAAWARQRLLVYRVGEGWPDLLVLDGPQRVRVLGRETALLAVSPDGRLALVFRRGASPVVVRLVDLATGDEVAAARLPGEIEWLLESGSWAEQRALASASPGLVVLRLDADAIELEQVLRFEGETFRAGLHEPHGDGERRIVAWGEFHTRPGQVVEDAAIVSCDRLELRCVRGPRIPVIAGPRLVHNPSRPLPGR
jgi:hypothetical protein